MWECVVKNNIVLKFITYNKIKFQYIKKWDERINILVEQINYWINHSTEKTVEIIELFY